MELLQTVYKFIQNSNNGLNTPDNAFGANKMNVYYATCFDSNSPNPVANRNSYNSFLDFSPAMENIIKNYLRE